ncbi:PLP-dependent cysteine synthase family protein [Hyphococcus sp.]|uniref:PLP-dependent cysteine synthase family protein n=1 Tax=Hyphococcus sp. TaxID=2038636 RepID=UPI003CCC1318
MRYPDAASLVAQTPLIDLRRVYEGPGRILGKCEFMQPGGSMKDRNGRWAIKTALATGALKPGGAVIEMTSGNMGAGLAVACAQYGHPFTAVMSEGNSIARAKVMEAFGATVIRVPQVSGEPGKVTGEDIASAQAFASARAEETGAYYVDQWRNRACFAAHYESTGPEIWNQTGGKVDAYVMMVGTGATLIGAGRYLKEQNLAIVVSAVEPEGAEPLAGKTIVKPKHVIQGAGYAHIPDLFDMNLMDESLAVSDDEAESWRRALGAREGVFVGYSAAANVCASAKLIASGRLGDDPTIVTILCDTGMKYF